MKSEEKKKKGAYYIDIKIQTYRSKNDEILYFLSCQFSCLLKHL